MKFKLEAIALIIVGAVFVILAGWVIRCQNIVSTPRYTHFQNSH